MAFISLRPIQRVLYSLKLEFYKMNGPKLFYLCHLSHPPFMLINLENRSIRAQPSAEM
jgi:hypothetical protein